MSSSAQTTPDFSYTNCLEGADKSHQLSLSAESCRHYFLCGSQEKEIMGVWLYFKKKKMVPTTLKLTSHTSEAPVRRRLLPAHRTRPFEGDCTTGSLRPRANYRLDEAV